jgi:transposase
MWMATTSLPKAVVHIFYRKLNRLLAEADFDCTVEEMCAPYYHPHLGRPSIPPGVYFRMLKEQFENLGERSRFRQMPKDGKPPGSASSYGAGLIGT